MWHVYILKCADATLYTGVTTNIDRRVNEHQQGRGGRYTRSRLPVTLVYQQSCRGQTRALRRELEIKSWTRQEKLALIRANSKRSVSRGMKRKQRG